MNNPRLAASLAFQAPAGLDAVMNDDDRKLERQIQHQKRLMVTNIESLTPGSSDLARLHESNMRELIAMRRTEVVEAMERERGLR